MSARESINHSYFYDALSGNFNPPSDPQGRTHTLGRLMIATFEKGVETNHGSHRQRHTYRPSWAPVTSVVHVSHWDMRSLSLEGDGRELMLAHTLSGKKHRSLQVIDTGLGLEPILEEPLGQEFGYVDLQERVSSIAQNFFNAFPAPQILGVDE